MTNYEDISGKTLYITGAGVSADSGIPTFRGEDGYWTIGSANYTPQEMATRQMYLGNPGPVSYTHLTLPTNREV